MTTPQRLQQWLDDARYLPPFMRDFHDQKDLFKAIDEIVQRPAGYFVERPDWVTAQCYTIDVFLHFMARRGYTLQRNRADLPFRDVEADVERVTKRRDEATTEIPKEAFSRSQP